MKKVTLIVGLPGTGKTQKMYKIADGYGIAEFFYGRADLDRDALRGLSDADVSGFDGFDIIQNDDDADLIMELSRADYYLQNVTNNPIKISDMIVTVCGTIEELPGQFKDKNIFTVIDLNQ